MAETRRGLTAVSGLCVAYVLMTFESCSLPYETLKMKFDCHIDTVLLDTAVLCTN